MADTVEVTEQATGRDYAAYNGDCCELIQTLPDDSIGFSVFSPPFASLYTYSDIDRDMGNCASDEEFFTHFGFLIRELYRVLKPGRLISVHCMNLPSTVQHNGYIGIRDFRGDVIRAFCGDEAGVIAAAQNRIYQRMCKARDEGDNDRASRLADAFDILNADLASHPADGENFIYHSEVCIWKDPVLAMQRTKALGLLHKQLVKDSCMSRQGIPDYVCTFRKPGKNPDPVSGPLTYFSGDESTFESTGNLSIDVWQRYASPVWDDIRQSYTLNVTEARGEKDERHVCPLQLDVIERCLQLWSKEGDTVLSPFMGIGSEGVMSVRLNRKFIGFELKPEYFNVACKNLRLEEAKKSVPTLF